MFIIISLWQTMTSERAGLLSWFTGAFKSPPGTPWQCKDTAHRTNERLRGSAPRSTASSKYPQATPLPSHSSGGLFCMQVKGESFPGVGKSRGKGCSWKGGRRESPTCMLTLSPASHMVSLQWWYFWTGNLKILGEKLKGSREGMHWYWHWEITPKKKKKKVRTPIPSRCCEAA